MLSRNISCNSHSLYSTRIHHGHDQSAQQNTQRCDKYLGAHFRGGHWWDSAQGTPSLVDFRFLPCFFCLPEVSSAYICSFSYSNGVCFIILQVGYFAFVSDIFEKDAEKINQDGMKRIQEAREYAHKKAQEREQVMPNLSPEQEQQMRQYLQMVGQHGMTKLTQISDQEECLNCPMLSKFPLKPPSK